MAEHVVVLGGGSSGEAFAGALRAEREDLHITVVERELVGGECSYWACMPSKTLLRPTEALAAARRAPGAAEAVSGGLDLERVFWWRDQVTGRGDDSSQERWLAERDIELVRGEASLSRPGAVAVRERLLEYDHLVVATGSRPVVPPLEGIDGVPFWTSRDATSTSSVPRSLIVLGGGVVGCELAQFFARAGSRVALVQQGPRLLDRVDAEAAEIVQEALAEEGVELLLDATAETVAQDGDGCRLRLAGGRELRGERLLVATGRRPNSDGYGLEQLPLRIGRRGIEVDDRLQAADGVWAIGDVTGVAQFTHVGKYQARVAAVNVAGGNARADYRAVPAVAFTDPPLASVGRQGGEGLVCASHRIDQTPRASTYERPKRRGLVKLWADPARRVLVGAVAVGPEAGEWLGQLTLAVRAQVPVDVLRDTIQPYPTFSEAIFLAARDLPIG